MRAPLLFALLSTVLLFPLGCAQSSSSSSPSNEAAPRGGDSSPQPDAGAVTPSEPSTRPDAGADAGAPPIPTPSGFRTHSAGPDMPTPRMYIGLACAPDGRVFAIGGQAAGPNGRGASASVEIYDPSKDAWTTAASMPAAGASAAAVGYDGRIYAFGQSGNYAYDPKTDAWRALSAPPAGSPVSAFSLVPMGHSLALVGGPQSANLFTYDIDKDTFVKGPAYPIDPDVPGLQVRRSTPAAGLLADGSLFMIGGFDANSPEFQASADTFLLAPNATSWTQGPSLPTSLARAAAVVDKQGQVFTFGGQSSGYVGAIETCVTDVLGFGGGSWTSQDSVFDPRVGGAACVDPKGTVYFVGGEAVSPDGKSVSLVGTMEIFSP